MNFSSRVDASMLSFGRLMYIVGLHFLFTSASHTRVVSLVIGSLFLLACSRARLHLHGSVGSCAGALFFVVVRAKSKSTARRPIGGAYGVVRAPPASHATLASCWTLIVRSSSATVGCVALGLCVGKARRTTIELPHVGSLLAG